MTTLGPLAALLLLALQAQAEPLEETGDQLPAQDQPGAKIQDITISFEGGHQSSSLCICRLSHCPSHECPSGFCPQIGSGYRLCCLR
uniref:Mammalian defensins domain-containing protein n=1 Tax=Equus asinus TaxID=9793 RepID=A0A9L0IUQ4_EQUAS